MCSLFLCYAPAAIASLQPVADRGSTLRLLLTLALGILLIALALLLRQSQRARRALEGRVAALTELSEASRAIVSAPPDVDALCWLIYQRAQRIVDTTFFQLGLFEDDCYHIKIWIVRGESRTEAAFNLGKGEGIIGWMRRTGRSLLVRDFAAQIDTLPARPRYLAEDPPRSGVFVPLVAGERVIGALAIQSDRPAAFTPEHLNRLSIIGNQAAAAIANARIYEAERQQRRTADTLGYISGMINSSLELDDVLQRILEGLEVLVDYDAAAILLLEEEGVLSLQAARGLPALEEAVGQRWPVRYGGRLQQLAEIRQPLIFAPTDEMGRYHELLGFPPDHSCLGAPILTRDEMLGVLAVDHRAPDRYEQRDAGLVAALAGQAASALENARLYVAEQEEAWISTALLEVAEATSHAESTDEVIRTVVRITPLLVGVDQCTILLWNEREAAYRVAATYQEGVDRPGLEAGRLIRPQDWLLLERLSESRAPVVDEFGALPGPGPVEEDEERTLLGLPLRAQGAFVGAMVIGFAGQVSFSEHRLRLIAGIANQTALAIESTQLAVARQEEAWVSLALLQVAEAIGRLSALDDVLAAVVRLTPLLVGVDSCLIYLWDEEAQAFVSGAAHGLSREAAKRFFTTPVPAGRWPEMEALADPAQVPVPAADVDEILDPGGLHQPAVLVPGPPDAIAGELGLDAPLALPLLAWDDLMGVLVVDASGDALPLADRRLSILSGVAQQTATAVQNARLYVASMERQRLARELELARQIQASFLPGEIPQVPGYDLAAYWQGARQVSGDFYDFIPPPEDDDRGAWGFIMADVADKGVPAALFMALSRTLVRTMAMSGREPAAVLMRANDMIIADAHSELFVTLFYALLDPGTGRLAYANGGHNPPLLLRAGSGPVTSLTAQGMALGILSGIEIEQRETVLAPGDLLIFYTDGVTDALNAQTQEFGLERLQRVVQAHREAPAAEVVAAINRAVDEFVGDTPQFDDFTLLVLKREQP